MVSCILCYACLYASCQLRCYSCSHDKNRSVRRCSSLPTLLTAVQQNNRRHLTSFWTLYGKIVAAFLHNSTICLVTVTHNTQTCYFSMVIMDLVRLAKDLARTTLGYFCSEIFCMLKSLDPISGPSLILSMPYSNLGWTVFGLSTNENIFILSYSAAQM